MIESTSTHVVASAASKAVFRVLDALLGISSGPIAKIADKFSVSVFGVEVTGDLNARESVEQRLARLDEARLALAESLAALDELKKDAEQSKAEYEQTRAALAAALASKQDAEHQLAEVRDIMAGEVSAFRLIAGLPNVRKERLIGLVIGIVGSAIFSLAVWVGKLTLQHFSVIP